MAARPRATGRYLSFSAGHATCLRAFVPGEDDPFNDKEQRAIFNAANTPLPLNYNDDPWTLNLVPLDKLVPPAPGFEGAAHCEWESLTPYVPPRHVYGRSGKEKPGCSVAEQLSGELESRGFPVGGLIAAVRECGWVKIHRIKSEQDARTNNDKLGYTVKFTFSEPVKGPISLGASSHFGLGLFLPSWIAGPRNPPKAPPKSPSTINQKYERPRPIGSVRKSFK